MNRRYSALSLRGHDPARTVLLRMAEDQDRAARIAELKERHPRLTWSKIAQEVGVTERAATQWRKTGALKPENAEALARLFNVDFDYIWTGPRPDTPELFADRRNTPAGPVAVSRLDGELEQRIHAIEETLAGIVTLLQEARSEQDNIRGLLDEQTSLLKDIRQATGDADDAAARLDAAVREADRALRSAPPTPPANTAKTAPKNNPRAAH